MIVSSTRNHNPLISVCHIYHLPLFCAESGEATFSSRTRTNPLTVTCEIEETVVVVVSVTNGQHQGELNELAGGEFCR